MPLGIEAKYESGPVPPCLVPCSGYLRHIIDMSLSQSVSMKIFIVWHLLITLILPSTIHPLLSLAISFSAQSWTTQCFPSLRPLDKPFFLSRLFYTHGKLSPSHSVLAQIAPPLKRLFFFFTTLSKYKIPTTYSLFLC